jgi:hypothetical protein
MPKNIPNVNIKENVKRILTSDNTGIVLLFSLCINAMAAIIIFLSDLVSTIHKLLPDMVFTIGAFIMIPVILYLLKGYVFELYLIVMQYHSLNKKYEREDEEE